MSRFIDQANQAVNQGDFAQANQYLHYLLAEVGTQAESSDTVTTAAPASKLEQAQTIALHILQFGDFQERWDIAKLFPKFGTVAIAPLLKLLQDEDTETELRWFVIRILSEFSHPSVLPTLVGLLKTTTSADLREMAATALAESGEKALPALMELLTDASTRLLALQALAQNRSDRVVPALLQVIDDPDPAIRATAVAGLTNYDHPAILPALIQALTDPAAQTRQAAVTGLGLRATQLGQTSPIVASERQTGFASDAEKSSHNWINLIQPLLSDLNLEVCRQSAIALGRIGTDAAADVLFESLEPPDTPFDLKLEIIRVLGWMEATKALDYLHQTLVKHLTYSDAQPLCREIIAVLGRVERPDLQQTATAALLSLLYASPLNADLQQSIASTLGQLGNQSAIEPLIQLLENPDLGVRLHTIAALKKLNPDLTHLRLQQLAQDQTLTPRLQQGVAIALQEW
jgi:HEAT repeat protein